MYKKYLTIALAIALLGAFSTMALGNSLGFYWNGEETFTRITMDKMVSEVKLNTSNLSTLTQEDGSIIDLVNQLRVGTLFYPGESFYIVPFLNLGMEDFSVSPGFYLGIHLFETTNTNVNLELATTNLFISDNPELSARLGFNYLFSIGNGGEE